MQLLHYACGSAAAAPSADAACSAQLSAAQRPERSPSSSAAEEGEGREERVERAGEADGECCTRAASDSDRAAAVRCACALSSCAWDRESREQRSGSIQHQRRSTSTRDHLTRLVLAPCRRRVVCSSTGHSTARPLTPLLTRAAAHSLKPAANSCTQSNQLASTLLRQLERDELHLHHRLSLRCSSGQVDLGPSHLSSCRCHSYVEPGALRLPPILLRSHSCAFISARVAIHSALVPLCSARGHSRRGCDERRDSRAARAKHGAIRG